MSYIEGYKSGLSLRRLAELSGMHREEVRRELLKQPGYHQLLVKVFILRCGLARTRKEMNVAHYTFRRHRPKEYFRWLMRQGPKLPGAELFGGVWRANCAKCADIKTIFADKRGSAWHWRCASCEAEGVVRTRQKRSTSLPSINKP